jgi:cytochrome c oxidase cbb3-type subunit 3
VLSDKAGELIIPIVQNGRPNPPAGAPPMPPFPLPADAVGAIAEYIHSVMARAGRQGRAREGEVVEPEQILVGDRAAGARYFAARCITCHSDADVKGAAGRAADPRELQNLWVAGGAGGRGGRGGTGRPVTVVVTPASGPRVEGRLVRIDDFIVGLVQEDGTRRTFVRKDAEPRVEVRDPADAHRALVPALAEKDMHDVTAYLWSIR